MSTLKFTSPLNIIDERLEKVISFGILSKVFLKKGNLAWEYNPFRNYRLSQPKYYFRNKYLTEQELLEEFGSEETSLNETNSWEDYKLSSTYPNGIKENESNPEFFDKNLLVDFETDELNLSLYNPVNILPLYSYDGSVNLIINDGKNTPKLINSRFSPLGRNLYLIVDRKGNNDTNIYDLGESFDTDTSLYKTYTTIPKLEFINVYSGGDLPIGNYHFYFRYVDEDGNETDFVAESGLVSIFKGNSLSTIVSGFRDENSQKSVRFMLEKIDPAYSYVNVYYTRSTSDIYLNAVVQAYKIHLKFPVNNALICSIFITGNEPKSEITIEELNPLYLIALNVLTQELCLNILFLGNILEQTIEYSNLSDLSLRFCAKVDTSLSYTPVNQDYTDSVKGTYSDPTFIYNRTGYLNGEIYRFGVVYLLNNGTLTPVFNIRGMFFDGTDQEYTQFPLIENESRVFISYDENTGIIYKTNNEDNSSKSSEFFENAYGVVKVFSTTDEFTNIRGIKIELSVKDTELDQFYQELKQCNVKGMFFVRLKRMPLRICLAYTIGIDSESNTPLLYTTNDVKASKADNVSDDANYYITERFFNDDKELNHEIDDRLYAIKTSDVAKYGAICPEYDVNSPYLNTLFCGDEYIVGLARNLSPLNLNKNELRHFYASPDQPLTTNIFFNTRVLGVEDNVKLVAIGSKMFSARAGEAEEAHRFEYITRQNKTTDATNIIRGSFGPYLAFDGYNIPGTLVNIYIKDWVNMSVLDLFKLRYNDKSPFYAISDRFALTDIIQDSTFFDNLVLYRGDSYICTFSHRLNRNFQDPSAPINHQIVDYECWKENFEYEDGILDMESFAKINLGDVNAVKLGLWVTFNLVSSSNLNIRALDDSNVDESALTGHPRGFFPYSGIVADGAFKTPEALCLNKGFNKSLSERHNFEAPNVPAIKNDFSNRISYSDIHVNDAFKNGYRVFQGSHYRDYPKTYGSITKLLELLDQLLCVFEHGIALIPVNERALAGEGTGGNIYINVSNVLPERMNVISDVFGSLWRDSIIKTPTCVYGVDTVAKKIWRLKGISDFQVISDIHVLEFLNNNITLTERELTPIIGIRNVKTHYNRFKLDVMFTFYDNLHGFEEKVWNLCWNEFLKKWITFYSWIPSYSENIQTQYFSFDRNTSKWIAKLGISKHGNAFADGVTLDENIIPNTDECGIKIGQCHLDNRTLPTGEGVEYEITYKLVRDPLKNHLKFKLTPDGVLSLNEDVSPLDLCSEFYKRVDNDGNELCSDTLFNEYEWKLAILKNSSNAVKNDKGQRIWLKREHLINPIPVILLNILANISVTNKGTVPELVDSFNNNTSIDAGYYLSTVAICPKYNLLFLSTDFWKHGLSGIIDIADTIKPTYWYGKQHPFEFEFVVAGDPRNHKIFDSLEIISNKAAPESFHYEIVGECYDFAEDKKNMYIRQEATKELYQYNGSDILFDNNYNTLESSHKLIPGSNIYKKSTLFPLYYTRVSTYNEIEDSYHFKDGNSQSKDYSNLAGGEIIYYDNLDEYRICNHVKAVDINEPGGRLRGNMLYREDKWYVLINPLNIVLKNEGQWKDIAGRDTTKIPVELGQNPLPEDIKTIKEFDLPESFDSTSTSGGRGYIEWNWAENQMKSVKLKDRFIKIRIRYSGEDLTLITALNTLYSLSVS